jgi:predicted enzyme related to lactoylglutathione lyase
MLQFSIPNPRPGVCLDRPKVPRISLAKGFPKQIYWFQSSNHKTTKEKIFMANPFVHVELNTTDVPKAKAFYGTLFGWKLEDMPMPFGTYTMINVGEGTGGGIMQHPMPGAPSAWLAYVLVDDIAAATEKAKSLGATVIKEVTEVMGAGWLSIIVDPTGAALGLWKPSGS